MRLIEIYKCFCELQRLRILNLLKEGPLCVCHLQEVLAEEQVKTSKQLSYMKKLRMVKAERCGFWMIYSLRQPLHRVVIENLKCLQDCSGEFPQFRADLKKREEILKRIKKSGVDCPTLVLSGQKKSAAARKCCR